MEEGARKTAKCISSLKERVKEKARVSSRERMIVRFKIMEVGA